MTTPEQFQALISSPEGSRVEFKAAESGYEFEKLARYCVALANEGGGEIVLGVTDRRPRRVVGTKAFAEPGRTEAGLFQKLHERVSIEEYDHEGLRVLIVHVPSHASGRAWDYEGAYLMRAGDALVPMPSDHLRAILIDTGEDFSAGICAAAKPSDLDPAAVEVLRRLWHAASPGRGIAEMPAEQLLADAELVIDGQVTYAALILLGTHAALGRHLAQAEVVFEYRSGEAPGPANDRREWRQGFLPVLDEVWRLIDLRNDKQSFQQGLVVLTVPTFNERAVREGVLNAVSHRVYRHAGSVFVRQYPRRIEIVSPGGFPQGVTPENVLWQQNPRNRRMAEVLRKCGLVERAGQGYDLIYRECIRQSKPLPDFTNTDANSVWLTLHGQIQDPEFLGFLEELGRERVTAFSTDDFLVIDLVHREEPIPERLKPRVAHLIGQGVIERVGRGRGVRLLLSQRFYRHLGEAGVYTRRRGLDRETNKALLMRHIEASARVGATLAELRQVLPSLSAGSVQWLVRQLKAEGKVRSEGATKAARWFPAARPASAEGDDGGE